MLSKKYYEKIAEILRNNKSETPEFYGLVNEFCYFFDNDNERFDREGFLQAVNSNVTTMQ